jgi:predicted O-linked N-acetylglucosamine transferase (SPINDLY family)
MSEMHDSNVSMDESAAIMAQAYDLARRGQFERAAALCAEVLRQNAAHPQAWLLRAVIAIQTGNPADAEVAARQSLHADPTPARVHALLGDALAQLGRPLAALEAYEAALSRDPGLASAHFGRGNALLALGRPREAVASFDRVLQSDPDDFEALLKRGNAQFECRELMAALDSYDRAVASRPTDAVALCNRGSALLLLANTDAALASFESALCIEPDLPEALVQRGHALRTLQRYAEAVSAYDQSLRLDPRNAKVHADRAYALLQWGDHGDEAIAGYVRALEIEPDIPFAPGQLLHAQAGLADWSVRVAVASRDRMLADVRAGKPVCAPFAFLAITDEATAQLECAQVFAREHGTLDPPRRRARRDRPAKIRVAYVSADLREHAVAYLLTAALERHDRARFETVGVSLRPPEASPMGERIRAAFDRFIDVSGMTDATTVQMLNGLEVDIAVDLTGYTRGFRPQIFALGAAPIQVGYLGYPGTMGAPFMDYLIADDFVIPPEARRFYSEAIVYLPDCFQANDAARAIGERPVERSAEGLPSEAFVFCCFNNSTKLNPRMFDVWMRLLGQVPGSALWLLAHEAAVIENLRREAATRGIDPERLIFARRIPYADHLARLRMADLFLDTVPFNAGATASDALWAGLPLLTCAGEAFAARMAGSLLRAVGLPELITADLDAYASRALELAQHPELLGSLQRRLIENRRVSPLFDTTRFVRHLESAYLEMWQRHARGEHPTAFSVAADP